MKQEDINDAMWKSTPEWMKDQRRKERETSEKVFTPAKCKDCGWTGRLRNCLKRLANKEENVPTCPNCKSDRIDW